MTYCTQCGSVVSESHKFCSCCGHAVEKGPAPPRAEVSPPPAAAPAPAPRAEAPPPRAEVPPPCPPRTEAVPPRVQAAPQAPPAREPPAFPLQFAGAFQPLPGERTVRLWRARYLNYGPKELAEGMGGLQESTKGILVATNQRLIYMHEKGALRTSGYEVVENIPFGSIRGLEARGNEVLVSLKDQDALTPRFMEASALDWNSLKNQNRLGADDLCSDLQGLFGWWASREAAGDAKEVLDYSVLKAKADRAGIAIRSARCPKCGADVPLPFSGEVARCPRCDGAVFPQDVVRRMRVTIE